MMNIKFFKILAAAASVLLLPLPLHASDTLFVKVADSLRLSYDFPTSVEYYRRALEEEKDSLKRIDIDEKMALSQNGQSMMDYCSQPVVIAKRKFSLKDFFLYYPLKDESWRTVPNQLDPDGGDPFARAVYVPSGANVLYYSAKDDSGIRNIYKTQLMDSLWSVPSLVNEQVTSSSDEIYPMESPDGKSLYFASKGLYGMGGYDLYVSRWNSELNDWDTPVNLGFPYSSPYDDFLFINTEDGKYSIFASNRECTADSVYLYVLEYDSMPVRKAVTSVKDLRILTDMTPVNDPSRLDNASAVSEKMPENSQTQEYMAKMAQVRSLRDTISAYNNALDEERAHYTSAPEEQKQALMADIVNKESKLPAMQDSLSKAVAELQKIEMDFLVKGVVIDPDKMLSAADKEVVGVSDGYTFTENDYGPTLSLRMMKPAPTFDYSFKILPTGRFAEDNTLPSGLVYQIQLFTIGQHATVKQIKGLSPVFEKLGPSLKYTYSVGVFRTYRDVLSNLNKVKRLGFRSASIVAFSDGKSISVTEARHKEVESRPLYQVKVYPSDGQNLSETAFASIHQKTTKDVARVIESGSVVYVIGPYDSKVSADSLANSLKVIFPTGVSVETVTPAAQ